MKIADRPVKVVHIMPASYANKIRILLGISLGQFQVPWNVLLGQNISWYLLRDCVEPFDNSHTLRESFFVRKLHG